MIVVNSQIKPETISYGEVSFIAFRVLSDAKSMSISKRLEH